MRQREQEPRVTGMGEPPPFVTERLDVEAAGGDDRLVLVPIDGANGVDQRSAAAEAFRGAAYERQLEVGKRLRTPAEVRPLREHAEAGARGVHERAVEVGELRRQSRAVG